MEKYTVHLVAHSHWDREWYLPYEVMRLRLVRMMDSLLSIIEKEPRFRSFTLDGQTVPLLDYLEVKPNQEEKLKRFIREGRIVAGPWYTLPDEFLVSGESIIRNLILGYRIAQGFGGVMKIGYLPDMFGHISQLPQILEGFGIKSAVLWRGIDEKRAEYTLQGPDGSEVFLLRLDPRLGYSKGFFNPLTKEGIRDFMEEEKLRTLSHHLLYMYGSDHAFPDHGIPDTIKELNKSLSDVRIIMSSLEDYIKYLKEETRDINVLYGEQRGGLESSPILSGVLSSRVYLKQKNEHIQNLLERWTEPFSTIAHTLGGNYRMEEIGMAWKYLLQNHAHDSICGCSVDSVHLDMERRFEWIEEICSSLLSENLEFITKNMLLPEGSIAVFNPLCWEVSNSVESVIETPNSEEFVLTDGKEIIPYEIKEMAPKDVIVPVPSTHLEKINMTRLGFRAEEVPPIGYRTYFIRAGKPDSHSRLKSGEKWVENENLRITIEENGTLTLKDKNTGEVYQNLNYFEDAGDRGDEYNYSPTLDNLHLNTLKTDAEIKKEISPPYVRFRIRKRFPVPGGLNKSMQRSRKTFNLDIETTIELSNHTKRVEFETTVINRAKNHRLRVVFPIGIEVSSCLTGSKFDMIERKTEHPLSREGWVEMPSGTFPVDHLIDLCLGKRGLALLTDGLKEGEIIDKSTIALTLLRCVGDLSRDDLQTRKGHAGFPISTPDAQCMGTHRFRYAIIPHSDRLRGEDILRESLEYSVGLKSLYNGKPRNGILPDRFSFLELHPEGIFISSLKLAEDKDGIILRIFNPTEETKDCTVRFFRSPKTTYLVDLNEDIIRELIVSGGKASLSIDPKKIVTILLCIKESP